MDDDAWGLSAALPVGVEAASRSTGDSDSSSATKLGLVIGLCAGGEGRQTVSNETACFGLDRRVARRLRTNQFAPAGAPFIWSSP